MAIVIRKRISFEFLGEEYANAYLDFQSIPVGDYESLVASVQEAEKTNKSVSFILTTLKKYFVAGVFPDIDEVTKDDLDGLDQESVLRCFEKLTGQNLDPKSETPLTMPSSMEQEHPSNS